jgi:hypothetical protein
LAYRDTASTHATTATTQAGIATTKAEEASASASDALTSRNQAETFAQQAQLSAESVDADNLVHKTGDETIAGIKTFTSSPVVPTPTTGSQAANKAYIDTQITGLGTAATRDVGTSAGNVMEVGAFGVGSVGETPYGSYRTNVEYAMPSILGINASQLTVAGGGRVWKIAARSNVVAIQTIGDEDEPPVHRLYHTGNIKTALNATGTAPIYACRAWVNFNGTGTVAIRASGNVSSITDNGVGDYTVNFTTAMPDANYTCSGMAVFGDDTTDNVEGTVTPYRPNTYTPSINEFRVKTGIPSNKAPIDSRRVQLSFHR